MESTHIVEQLSFSMLPSILTFDFDLILGSFLTFWGPNGLFLGFKNCFGVSSYKLIIFVFRVSISAPSCSFEFVVVVVVVVVGGSQPNFVLLLGVELWLFWSVTTRNNGPIKDKQSGSPHSTMNLSKCGKLLR